MKRNERNTESVSGRHEAPAIGKETYSSYEEQPRPEKRKAKKKSFNATSGHPFRRDLRLQRLSPVRDDE